MHRMVVIDDEYIVVEGIKAILERKKLNCEVVGFAYNGIDALDVIAKKKPDIVITDIRMPGLDGLSLIEACQEFLPDTNYIVISGYTEFEYARKALSLGVKDYLDKPVTIEKVMDVIERIDKTEGGKNYLRKQIAELMDEIVNNAISRDRIKMSETVHKYLQSLSEYSDDFNYYKQEIFKMLAVVLEIYNDQIQETDKKYQVSYSEIEEWKDRTDANNYVERKFIQIAETIQGERVGSNHRIIKQILCFIEENYNKDIGLNELADMVGMNPAYLSILFRDEVGVSYVKYLTELRIKHAKNYLDAGHKVCEVSEMVGYNNYRYFCDIFKKHVGQTPNEYKGCTRRRE